MLLQNSSSAKRRIFVDWILQGSEAVRSHGEGSTRLLGKILGSYADPFVSKMRNADQRASKISNSGQIGVLQQNWPKADSGGVIEQLVVSFASTAAMGPQMSSTAVTERTAFRVADYTFWAAGILLVLYWGMLLLGKVEAPIANSPTLAGAVALAGALRTAAHWLKGDRQPLDPLRILIWMFVALGGLTLMIFD